jgi:hypothetical protein
MKIERTRKNGLRVSTDKLKPMVLIIIPAVIE